MQIVLMRVLFKERLVLGERADLWAGLSERRLRRRVVRCTFQRALDGLIGGRAQAECALARCFDVDRRIVAR